MFGSNASGNSLFGANKPATGGFGAPSSGFSLNNSTTTNTTGQSSGGLFGAAPAAPTLGALNTNSSSLSGANNATANNNTPSGGLFGSANANNANNNPTGGLFGKPAANPATGSAGTGLFGSNNAAPTSGGLFGSNNTASSGGMFGATPAAPATGGLFGTAQAQPQTQTQQTGLLGNQQQTQQQQNALFGNQQQNLQTQQPQQQQLASSQPAFVWSQQSSQGQQQQQQPLSFLSSSKDTHAANNNYAISMQEQLSKVKNSWDPTSQQTALKTYFYNKVAENQAALYTKPANEDDEWDKAFEARPADTVPVRAVGFGDLEKRSQTQVNHVAQARVVLQQISEKYKMLSDKHELDTASRIVAAKARHIRVSRRILRLVSTLAVLKSKGYQLSPSEETLIQGLQALLEKSQDPSGLGKTNELWARLAILKEKAKSLGEQVDTALGIKAEETEENGEQRQRQVLQIAQVLQEQQKGLKCLADVVGEDQKTVEALMK